MDYGGRLRLIYVDGNSEQSIDLGTMESFSESFVKACSVTPIVSRDMDDSIAIESGSGLNISIRCSRVNPGSAISGDSVNWCNRHWYEQLTRAVNRWQARSNGFTLTYAPETDKSKDGCNPYIPAFTYNGYVKSLSRKYDRADPTRITISLEFHVGTMTMNGGVPAGTYATLRDDFSVSMSDSLNQHNYSLLSYIDGEEVGCLDSYTMYGGINTPFEYVVLKIPVKALNSMVKPLVGDIKDGHNMIRINAVGAGEYIVSKTKISGDMYTITAYCIAEKYRGMVLGYNGENTALGWIMDILTSGTFGATFTVEESQGRPRTLICGATDLKGEENMLAFSADDKVWYVLQVCAMYIGCRIFFTGRNAYVVDYRTTDWGVKYGMASGSPVHNAGALDLYPLRDTKLYGRLKGSAKFGNEGTDTLVNVQSVTCTAYPPSENSLSTKEIVVKDADSIKGYNGEYKGETISIRNLLQGGTYAQGDQFATMFLEYRREAQKSVTFSLKELEFATVEVEEENGKTKEVKKIQWSPVFWESTTVPCIYDMSNSEAVTWASEIGKGDVPQKLLMSSWARHYPDGVTEYSFGVISNIDLSSSTSLILSGANNL